MVFDAICTSNCYYVSKVMYRFYVYKYNNSDWQLINGDGDINNFEKIYIYGDLTRSATVLYNLFKSGLNSWKVDLVVTTVNIYAETKTRKVTQIYKLNKLPYNGTCSVSPTSGYALQTYFNIFCQYWADHDGSIVRYEYFGKFFKYDLNLL